MQKQSSEARARFTASEEEPAQTVDPFSWLGMESSVCIEEQLEKEGAPFKQEDGKEPSAPTPAIPEPTALFDHVGLESSVSLEEELEARDFHNSAP